MRIELGPATVSALAVENLELSTTTLSQGVRRGVIARRRPQCRLTIVPGGRTANLLSMHDVRLVTTTDPAGGWAA